MILKVNDKIFLNSCETINFLLENQIVNEDLECEKCNSRASLLKTKENAGSLVYRCKTRG